MTKTLLAGLVFAAFVPPPANSQISGTSMQPATSRAQVSDQPSTLRGIVVNANTGQPIARALIRVEGRAALTEHDGRFEFSNLSGTTASIRVTKPGFYESLDPFQSGTQVTLTNGNEDVSVPLYPEALVTGTVNSASGDPLAQVRIVAFRRTDDEMGLHWRMSAQSTSDADGEFRLPLPGGDYVIETLYSPERPGQHEAILPLMIPSGGSTAGSGSAASVMHLASGSEQHLDLRPQLRATHAVYLRVEGDDQGVPQIEAHLSNGLSFTTNARPSETPGEVVATLPSGTYTLSATAANGDATSYGETRVTIGDHDVSGVVMHLTRALPLSVELAVDPAVTSDNPPAVQQLGVFFYKTNAGISPTNQTVYLSQRRGDSFGVSLLPGSYRLRAQNPGPWFIESASLGGTDLLTQDLVVDEGSSSMPLRLVVSNQTATMKSTVKLSGHPAACWVYLVAATPSATPVLSTRSASDGTLSYSSIPAGSYQVIAFEMRHPADLGDPAVLAQFAPYVKTITLAAGETATTDLDAVPASELRH